MKCADCNCNGVVNTEKKVSFGMGGCGTCARGIPESYPCSSCGKLHWPDGNPVLNRGGDPTFLKNDRIAIRKRDGEFLYL